MGHESSSQTRPGISLTVEVEYPDRPAGDAAANLRSLLDLIDEQRLPVTFFLDHRWVGANPDMAKRVAASAAGIGLTLRSGLTILPGEGPSSLLGRHVRDVEAILAGPRIRYVRLPFSLGEADQPLRDALKAHDLIPVGWTHASRDWDPMFSDAESLAQVEPAVRNGGIILFHSWPERTASVLRAVVEMGEPEQFVGLDGEGILQAPGPPGATPSVTTHWESRTGAQMTVHYFSRGDSDSAVALVVGEPANAQPPLVRLHSACLTSEVLDSTRCDCKEQLDEAIEEISKRGAGVLVYFPDHEGRGIGLEAKLRAYALQDSGLDTTVANQVLGLEVDSRKYEVGADIFRFLGLTSIEMMTNNPLKIEAMEKSGFTVTRTTAWSPEYSKFASEYVDHKKEAMGHLANESTGPE